MHVKYALSEFKYADILAHKHFEGKETSHFIIHTKIKIQESENCINTTNETSKQTEKLRHIGEIIFCHKYHHSL